MNISDDTKAIMAASLCREGRTYRAAWLEVENLLASAPNPEQSSGNPGGLTSEGREALVWWIEEREGVRAQLSLPHNWRDYITEPQPEPTEEHWTKALDTWDVNNDDWINCCAVSREAYRLAMEGR